MAINLLAMVEAPGLIAPASVAAGGFGVRTLLTINVWLLSQNSCHFLQRPWLDPVWWIRVKPN